MKAIILAAGEGNRLKPYTDNYPKCMIALENQPIFDRQVDCLKRCGIEKVIAVKGYMREKITREDVSYYVNEQYDKTNMVMTLWCAAEEFDSDVIISYGDIIYNDEVLKTAMASEEDISVVVDDQWRDYWQLRFEDPLSDAEALKIDENGCIKVIGQKANTLEDVESGYIGLIKFTKKGLDAFKKSFLNAKTEQKPWGVSKAFENLYMTDMLQGLINEGNDVHAVRIHGGWLEIDDPADYALAQNLFENGKVKKISKEKEYV